MRPSFSVTVGMGDAKSPGTEHLPLVPVLGAVTGGKAKYFHLKVLV